MVLILLSEMPWMFQHHSSLLVKKILTVSWAFLSFTWYFHNCVNCRKEGLCLVRILLFSAFFYFSTSWHNVWNKFVGTNHPGWMTNICNQLWWARTGRNSWVVSLILSVELMLLFFFFHLYTNSWHPLKVNRLVCDWPCCVSSKKLFFRVTACKLFTGNSFREKYDEPASYNVWTPYSLESKWNSLYLLL